MACLWVYSHERGRGALASMLQAVYQAWRKLIVKNPAKRATCRQVLESTLWEDLFNQVAVAEQEAEIAPEPKPVGVHGSNMNEMINSSLAMTERKDEASYQGVLCQLKEGGNPAQAPDWEINRQFILTPTGALCVLDGEEVTVVISAGAIRNATILGTAALALSAPAFPHVFAIEEGGQRRIFAPKTGEEVEKWTSKLEKAKTSEANITKKSFNLASMKEVRVRVNNKRTQISADMKLEKASFQGTLQKLNSNGAVRSTKDYRERTMWLAQDGSFCYNSKKQEEPLIYLSAADMKNVEVALHDTVSPLPEGETTENPSDDSQGVAFAHTFSLRLKAKTGVVVYEPCYFAAASAQERDTWVEQIRKLRA